MHPLSTFPLTDTATALVCLIGAVVLIAGFAFLNTRVTAARNKLSTRIAVTGTRGKSTTVRLVLQGLRSNDITAVGRVSGTDPKWIDAAGNETKWHRTGSPQATEVERIVMRAAATKAQALVVENMAINASVSRAILRGMIKPHVLIITNMRRDHLEEAAQGIESESGRILALLPAPGASIVATSEAASPLLQRLAAENGNPLVVVPPTGMGPLEDLCALSKMALHVAVPGFEPSFEITGIATQFLPTPITHTGRTFSFFDAFACNDVESLQLLWQSNGGKADAVLLNTRSDRPLRTREFLNFLKLRATDTTLFLTGDPLSQRMARQAGFPQARYLSRHTAELILTELSTSLPDQGIVWGLGNHQGVGARLQELLRERTC